jgi:uncharacterized membrane-anchored protein YitT (DUF2179 family)
MPKLYKNIGLLFVGTGMLHTALGVLLFGNHLVAIYSAGLINGIGQHFDRGFAFWFVFAGLLMIILGYLMDWVVRKNQLRLPKSFGYLLIEVCLIGILVMPIGGFWLILLQGIYIVIQANKKLQVTAQLID